MDSHSESASAALDTISTIEIREPPVESIRSDPTVPSPATDAPDEVVIELSELAFNYGNTLPEDIEIAKACITKIGDLNIKTLATVCAIGAQLIAAKEAIDHGVWGGWLAHYFRWSQRTANNYMSTHLAFGHRMEIVAKLPMATVYRLSAPSVADAREDIVAQLQERDGFDVPQIEDAIKEARGEKRASKETKQPVKALNPAPMPEDIEPEARTFDDKPEGATPRLILLVRKKFGAEALDFLALLKAAEEEIGGSAVARLQEELAKSDASQPNEARPH